MFKNTIVICLVTFIILVLDLTVVLTKEKEPMEDYYEENNYVERLDASEEDDDLEIQQEVEDGRKISKVNMIRCSRRFTPGVCLVRVQPVWTFDVMVQGCNMRMGCSEEVGRENRFSNLKRCHKACVYLTRLYNHALLQESQHSHMEHEDELSSHSDKNEDGRFDFAKPSLRARALPKNRGTDIDIYYDVHSTEETEEEMENEPPEPYDDDHVFEDEDLQQNYDTSNVESDLIEVEDDKTFLDDDIQ